MIFRVFRSAEFSVGLHFSWSWHYKYWFSPWNTLLYNILSWKTSLTNLAAIILIWLAIIQLAVNNSLFLDLNLFLSDAIYPINVFYFGNIFIIHCSFKLYLFKNHLIVVKFVFMNLLIWFFSIFFKNYTNFSKNRQNLHFMFRIRH